MTARQINDSLRKQLISLLAEDRPDSAWLLSRLEDLRRSGSDQVFSGLVYLLAHIQLPETQAKQLLRDLLAHRDRVTQALHRDPGLRVATIDYLSNVKKLLANPTIVESSQLERTERSAVTDELTRLYNRRHFSEVLALEVRRSHRYSLRLSLLMLDIDAFKQLNDRHGHLFGDLVLQRVAQVLRRAVRDADVACRYGGEEFAVILPETDRLGGYAVAERIRHQLHREFSDRPVGGKSIRVSVSGGIAAYPVDGTDPQALIARADKALYLAKRLGKDRVSLYHAERRRAVRYPAKVTARASLTHRRRGEICRVRPVNLSRHGALIDLDSPLAPAVPVEITFNGRDTTGRPSSWMVTATVVRVDGNGPAGAGCRAAVAFEQPISEECLLQQIQRARSLRTALEARA